MRGVRFYGSRFIEAFGCILPELDALTVYGVSFRIPEAIAADEAQTDACCAELREMSPDGTVDFDEGFFRPGFFRKYAAGVLDDWNAIFLFDREPPTREELRRTLERRASGDYLESHRLAREAVAKVDPVALLQNWDGAYWQLFSKNDNWANRVIAAAKDRGANCRLVDFATEYPEPADIALWHALADHERRRNPMAKSAPVPSREVRKQAWIY